MDVLQARRSPYFENQASNHCEDLGAWLGSLLRCKWSDCCSPAGTVACRRLPQDVACATNAPRFRGGMIVAASVPVRVWQRKLRKSLGRAVAGISHTKLGRQLCAGPGGGGGGSTG